MTNHVVKLDWTVLKSANYSPGETAEIEWFFHEDKNVICLNGPRKGHAWGGIDLPDEPGYRVAKEDEIPDDIAITLAVYRLTGKLEEEVQD